MDLEISLNQVLQALRNSSLHFSAQETPYSLYISIRKKIKQNQEDPSQAVAISSSNHYEEIGNLSKECTLLEDALERTKNELVEEIDHHKRTIEEKGELSRQLTSKKKLNEKLSDENEALKAEISALDSDVKAMKKMNKIKEKELQDTIKVNKTLSEKVEASNMDLKMMTSQVKKYEKDALKNSKIKEVKEPQTRSEFPCAICTKKYESSLKLNVHVKLDHCKVNSSQTDAILMEPKSSQTRKKIFVDNTVQVQPINDDADKKKTEKINIRNPFPYLCFYCEKDIRSELHLMEHKITCLGAAENWSLFSFPVRPRPFLYQCAKCGLVADTEAEILNHKKNIHGNQ